MPEINGVDYETATTVARLFGVSRQTVYRWIKEGLINDYVDMGPEAKTRYLIRLVSLKGFVPPGSIPGSPGWSARDKPDVS
jgi:excisionase family DNA binding protein